MAETSEQRVSMKGEIGRSIFTAKQRMEGIDMKPSWLFPTLRKFVPPHLRVLEVAQYECQIKRTEICSSENCDHQLWSHSPTSSGEGEGALCGRLAVLVVDAIAQSHLSQPTLLQLHPSGQIPVELNTATETHMPWFWWRKSFGTSKYLPIPQRICCHDTQVTHSQRRSPISRVCPHEWQAGTVQRKCNSTVCETE